MGAHRGTRALEGRVSAGDDTRRALGPEVTALPISGRSRAETWRRSPCSDGAPKTLVRALHLCVDRSTDRIPGERRKA
jgi:hypothetical protein